MRDTAPAKDYSLRVMAGLIPQSFINDLIARVDIVDVIGARVQLKKAGSNHKGLCPFHNEKTPSFNVNQDRQFYHCFGCEAHGTAIGFLMEYDGLTFPEAIEALASTVGVTVPREQGREPPRDTSLYEVLESADAEFRRWLRSKEDAAGAVAYLKSRGLTGEIARDFGIGLAPTGWDGIKNALSSFGEEKLIAAGLVVRNEKGRTYDRFRERIIFPIRDTRGRVIGFGGRVYGEGEPKYINSPETDVFRKGRELYGLYEARRAQRRLQSVLVVEGYMDVVALAQHGVVNSVATLGTAIGQPHFQTLYRHVDVVVCCFDGDEAGRGAAWKAVDAAFPVLSGTRQLKFVFLPEGEDPDTIIRSRGREHFRELVDQAVPVGEYFVAHLEEGLDLDKADARALLSELAVPHIGRLPNGALRRVIVDGLAERTGIDAATLDRAAGQSHATDNVRSDPTEPFPEVDQPSRRPLKPSGSQILFEIVKDPELIAVLDSETQVALAKDANISLLADVASYLLEEPDADTGTLLARYVGHEGHDQLAEFAARPLLLPTQAGDFAAKVRKYIIDVDLTASSRAAEQSGWSLEDLRRHAQRRQEML